MPATHTGGSATLAGTLTRRRKELDLSVAEVARLAALPLTTTQRRFFDATGIKHTELVAIARALKTRPSTLLAEAEAAEDAINAAELVSA
ncbi:hypothetical protein GCM10027059_26260 [Myceligenerans halotolerans]